MPVAFRAAHQTMHAWFLFWLRPFIHRLAAGVEPAAGPIRYVFPAQSRSSSNYPRTPTTPRTPGPRVGMRLAMPLAVRLRRFAMHPHISPTRTGHGNPLRGSGGRIAPTHPSGFNSRALCALPGMALEPGCCELVEDSGRDTLKLRTLSFSAPHHSLSDNRLRRSGA